ncbi:hypothetical protein [Limosilactobacillus fastidiosus]|uniref:hypothetical protein n=1 Tax=Limosilactobacillus fastidiosus TaxID=2759855 RepID=UPI001E62BD88|nr:hypothetical protein [Limosilactobacillus fastidiosus]MCD7085199.1 hypothetical protein [Limosilactobacillus fastidiosus]
MTELTNLWLNGYHEQAITHGLTQTLFRHQLAEMGYTSPELDQLSNQLEQELERLNIPTEITIKFMTGGRKVLRGQEALDFYRNTQK